MASRQTYTLLGYLRGTLLLAPALGLMAEASLMAQQPSAKQEEQAAPLDRYGDVLPPGAKARLGMLWLQRDRGAHRACFGLTPDGKTIVTFSHGRRVKLWDADTGKLREQRELPVKLPFHGCLSADGRLLAGRERDYDTPLDFWDVRAGKRVQRIPLPKRFSLDRPVFSPEADLRTPHQFAIMTGMEG